MTVKIPTIQATIPAPTALVPEGGDDSPTPQRKRKPLPLQPPSPVDTVSTSALLARAAGIVQRELIRLDTASLTGGLDRTEVSTVQDLVKTLSSIHAEERLQAAKNKFDDLSDDELKALSLKALGITADELAAVLAARKP